MQERYGKWNAVYMRFRRWAEQGVWDGLLKTLVDLVLTDDWQDKVNSTTVRGHVSAAGALVYRDALIPAAPAIAGVRMPFVSAWASDRSMALGDHLQLSLDKFDAVILQAIRDASAIVFKARNVVHPQSKGLKHVLRQHVRTILGAILGAVTHY